MSVCVGVLLRSQISLQGPARGTNPEEPGRQWCSQGPALILSSFQCNKCASLKEMGKDTKGVLAFTEHREMLNRKADLSQWASHSAFSACGNGDGWGDANRYIFTYLMGSIFNHRIFSLASWVALVGQESYGVQLTASENIQLKCWGCEMVVEHLTRVSARQREPFIVTFFTALRCLLPLEYPQKKKREGGSAKSMARVLSRTFPAFLSEWQNLLLLIYFTAGFLPVMCV